MTQDRSADEAAIWEQMGKGATAFRNLDAEALQGAYAQDADWTNAFGTTRKGADEILAYLRNLFADPHFAAGKVVGQPQAEVRFVTEDVAIVKTYLERAQQQTVEGGELPVRRNHSIKVLQRQGDEWLIVSEMFMDEREEQTLIGDKG